MLIHLHGCRIGQRDADILIHAPTAEGSATSLETAAAIRWAPRMGSAQSTVEPDMQAAILNAIDGDTSPALT